MDGPASPFLWNLACDPIVTELPAAIGAPCPAYIDDLSGIAVGHVQAARLLVRLPVLCHAAGLAMHFHVRSSLVVSASFSGAVIAFLDLLSCLLASSKMGSSCVCSLVCSSPGLSA